MDFLNTAYAQLSDLFRSMTIGARITAGLLLAVVVISLSWLFQHQVSGGNTYLFGGQSFSTAELNAMEAAFAKAGLNGYEVAGGQIRIPRSQQAAYVAALADDNALPMNWNQYLARALESNSPFISAKEREDRLRIATQQELSLVLKSMFGAANASVHYDSQKKPRFGQPPMATASVMIEMVGGRTLDETRVQMIREMVAGCFADLTPEKVKVSDGKRVYSVPGVDGLGSSGSSHLYITTKADFEKQYEKKIQDALAYVPGVTVSVNAVLETDLGSSTRITKHDPKTVPTDLREETTTIKSESAPRGGAPGLQAQQPPVPPNQPVRLSDTLKGSTNEEERSSREERNLVNTESTETRSIGLTPRRVTVVVGVPSGYFEEVWRRRNPTPEGQTPQPPDPKALENIVKEEKERIQAHVVPLIPKPSDEIDPTPLVTVTPFTEIPEEPIPAPSIVVQTLGWLGDNWQALGLVVLVAASLLMVRSIVRTAPPETRRLEFTLPELTPSAEEKPKAEATGETAKSRLKRRVASGKSLRDELTDMVREDPDTAANILRGWIGTGN